MNLSRIKIIKLALRDDYFARILFNLLILAITSSIVTLTIILVKARDIQLLSDQNTEISKNIGESYNESSQNHISKRNEMPTTTSSIPEEITLTTEHYGVTMEKNEAYKNDATNIKRVFSAISNPTSTGQVLSTSATSSEPMTISNQDVVTQRRDPLLYPTEMSMPDVESLSPTTVPQTSIEQATSWSTLMYKWKTEAAAVVSTPTTHFENPLNYRTIQKIVDSDTEQLLAANEDGLESLLNLESDTPIEIQIQIPISEDDSVTTINKDITFEEAPILNEKNIRFEEHHNIDELHRVEVHKTHDCGKRRSESDGELSYLKYQPYDVNKKFYKQLPYLIANSHNHLKRIKGERLTQLNSGRKTNKLIKNSKRDLYGSNLGELNNYGTNRLDPKYTYESSAEKEEKLNKALEGFTHALNIFAQMDTYFSTRLKTTIKKLAKLCEEEGPIL